MNAENMYDAWDNGDRHEIRQQFAKREKERIQHMTDRELMQQSLVALETCKVYGEDHDEWASFSAEKVGAAVIALRERLAQPQQPMVVSPECAERGCMAHDDRVDGPGVVVQQEEPVAWGMRDMNGNIYDCISVQEHARAEGDYNVPLYTTPPRREWVGLTEEEVENFVSALWPVGVGAGKLLRAIEAKLKEKNA